MCMYCSTHQHNTATRLGTAAATFTSQQRHNPHLMPSSPSLALETWVMPCTQQPSRQGEQMAGSSSCQQIDSYFSQHYASH